MENNLVVLQRKVSVSEAAEIVGCDEKVIRAALKKGDLVHYRLGCGGRGKYQIVITDLDNWYRSQRVERKPSRGRPRYGSSRL